MNLVSRSVIVVTYCSSFLFTMIITIYIVVVVCVINITVICLSVFLTECAPGFFGADCQNACECENDGTCDRQDGKCTCPAGWVGLKCEKGK